MRIGIFFKSPDVGDYPSPDPNGYTDEYKRLTADYALRYADACTQQAEQFAAVYGGDVQIENRVSATFFTVQCSEATYRAIQSDIDGGKTQFIKRLYVTDPRPPILNTVAHYTRMYYEMTWQAYEALVLAFLGLDGDKYEYEVVVDMEWGNDESHAFLADGDTDPWTLDELEVQYAIPEYTKNRIQIALPSPGEMLNLMVLHGAIPAGYYLITISW